MQLSEAELDLTLNRIDKLEQEIYYLTEQMAIVSANIQNQIESLKETQRYLIKLAHNQQEMTKRISAWPYIVIEKENK